MADSEEELKSLLMKVKEESEKTGLKLNIQKAKYWNSNTLTTWCKELTYWKRPWYWERLKVGGEADNRGWDGWMESLTRWTWDWASSGSWWWTGKPGVLQSTGSQRVRHYWATELNWTTLSSAMPSSFCLSLSQHQSLFSLHQVAKVLELQLQHQSFQWIFSVYFL